MAAATGSVTWRAAEDSVVGRKDGCRLVSMRSTAYC